MGQCGQYKTGRDVYLHNCRGYQRCGEAPVTLQIQMHLGSCARSILYISLASMVNPFIRVLLLFNPQEQKSDGLQIMPGRLHQKSKSSKIVKAGD